MPGPDVLALLGLAGPHELLLFAASVLVLNATPGVDMLLTITRTLQGGPRAGVAAALGINAGCIVHTLAAAFGLAAVLAVSGTAFALLKWLGAAYLLWLAVGMWRAAWQAGVPGGRSGGLDSPRRAPPRSAGQDFRTGFVTNVLNPKVAVFFLAFIPQFIAPATADKTLAFLGLGAVFVCISTPFLLLVVALVARLRRSRTSTRLACGLNVIGGGLFALLALRLAVSRTAGA